MCAREAYPSDNLSFLFFFACSRCVSRDLRKFPFLSKPGYAASEYSSFLQDVFSGKHFPSPFFRTNTHKGTVIFFLGKRQTTSQKKVRTHAKKNYAVKKIMSGEKNYRGKLQWGKYRYQKYFPTNFCPQKIG